MRKTIRSCVALAVGGLLIAGCSSSKSSESTTTTTVSVCDQSKALQQSIEDLKTVDVVKNGTTALSSAVDQVKADASALSKSGKTEVQPQIDALNQAISSFQSAAKTAESGNASDKAAAVTAGAAAVTAASNLSAALKNLKC